MYNNMFAIGGEPVTIEIVYQNGMELSQYVIDRIKRQVTRLIKYANVTGRKNIMKILDGVAYHNDRDLSNFAAMIDSDYNMQLEDSYSDGYGEGLSEPEQYSVGEPQITTVYTTVH